MPRKTREEIREPWHPGDILYYVYMKPNNITQLELHRGSGINLGTISRILKKELRITPRVALGLAKYFKNDKYYWIRIQTDYDFWELEKENSELRTPNES